MKVLKKTKVLISIFFFVLSLFIVFVNSGITVFAEEQTGIKVDDVLKINPKSYSGYGCGSTCGASREDGYSSTYHSGCRNWQVMPIIDPLYK